MALQFCDFLSERSKSTLVLDFQKLIANPLAYLIFGKEIFFLGGFSPGATASDKPKEGSDDGSQTTHYLGCRIGSMIRVHINGARGAHINCVLPIKKGTIYPGQPGPHVPLVTFPANSPDFQKIPALRRTSPG